VQKLSEAIFCPNPKSGVQKLSEAFFCPNPKSGVQKLSEAILPNPKIRSAKIKRSVFLPRNPFLQIAKYELSAGKKRTDFVL